MMSNGDAKIYDLIELGKDCFNRQRYSEAFGLFQKAMLLDSGRADIYFELGKIKFFTGEFNEAKKYLKKTVELDNTQIFAYDLLIKTYLELKDFKSLEKLFCRIRTYCSLNGYVNNIPFVKILFKMADVTNKYGEIIKILKENIKYLKTVPDNDKNDFLLLTANVYMNGNRKEKALAYLAKYIKNVPSDLRVKFDIAKEYIGRNKIEQAYSVLKELLITDKNVKDYGIWEQLSIVIGKTENKKYKKNDFEKFFDIVPDDFKKIKNIILNELEILDGKKILKSMPRTLIVTLTSNCNIRCLMCKAHKYPWNLPEKTKSEIADLMPYLESVVWLGGEVFLYKYFDELFEIANKSKVRQEIITNAMLLDEQMIIKLVANNVNLAVSVDGVTKEVFEHIRVGSSFEKLITSLELIKFYRKKFNCTGNYRMNVLILRSNYRQILDFVEFAHKYEFTTLYINGISSDLVSDENIFYFYKDDKAIAYLDGMRNVISDKTKKYNIELHNSIPTPKFLEQQPRGSEELKVNLSWLNKYGDFETEDIAGSYKTCFVPWKKMMVDRDGYVRPDCFCKRERALGNILSDSLLDLWNNKAMQIYRTCVSKGYRAAADICQLDCLAGRVPDVYRK